MDYKDIVTSTLNDAFLAGLGAVSFAAEGLARTGEKLVEKGARTFEKSKTLDKELKHDFKDFLDVGVPEASYTDVELDVFIDSLSSEQFEALKSKVLSKGTK